MVALLSLANAVRARAGRVPSDGLLASLVRQHAPAVIAAWPRLRAPLRAVGWPGDVHWLSLAQGSLLVQELLSPVNLFFFFVIIIIIIIIFFFFFSSFSFFLFLRRFLVLLFFFFRWRSCWS
mgnify:CR=1 FL=1